MAKVYNYFPKYEVILPQHWKSVVASKQVEKIDVFYGNSLCISKLISSTII